MAQRDDHQPSAQLLKPKIVFKFPDFQFSDCSGLEPKEMVIAQ
jgi:hypothetical protein